MKGLSALALLILVACATVGTVSAQTAPEFKLGFKTLAEQLPPDVVGVPVENEHFNLSNGNSEQHTTRGLMVWRKADNWTAYTNGYMTWVNGPNGVQSRLNTERFEWEDAAPVSTPAPAVPIPAIPRPTQTPGPTPTPASPKVSCSNPNVIQGQVVYADTVWALGEVRNDGSVPAYDVKVSGRLLSASGSVAGADDDYIPVLGAGDSVAYALSIKNPSPYVKAEISVTAESEPSSMGYMKGNVSNTGLRKASDYFYFAGIVTNGNSIPLHNMQVRTWFLDAQGNVVDVTTNYFGGDLPAGGTTNFDKQSTSARYNPKVSSVTQGKAYVWGYK